MTAVWVPSLGEGKLKMELWEMIITSCEKRGSIQIGPFGLPKAVIRVLEVKISFKGGGFC